MDFKKILGKLDSIEPITESKTNETLSLDSGPGAKFPGYWKGTDKGMPGNKLVGSKKNKETKSLLKNLAKGKTPKTLEEVLEEMYKEFKDTLDKRPAREGARHTRGHKPKEQYTIIKDDDNNGWTYEQEIEQYDDVSKIFHYAVKDGKKVDMDWSPYTSPSDKEFKLWVDLGMPTRKAVKGIGPLDKDDLITIAKSKKGTENLLKISEYKIVPLKDKEEYQAKLKALQQLQSDPNTEKDPEMKAHLVKRLQDLHQQAEEQGLVNKESKAGKTLDTWFKNKDTRDSFAKGDSRIPHHSERPKTKPVDLSKPIKEYEQQGTVGTVGTTGTVGTDGSKPDQEKLDQVAKATSTLKQATGSTVQPGQLAKAIDDASQGKATNQQDMKALEPMMDVIKTAAENPDLANQMKPIIQRAKQLQQKG